MKQAPNETPPEVLSSTQWCPYFAVSIHMYVDYVYVFEMWFL